MNRFHKIARTLVTPLVILIILETSVAWASPVGNALRAKQEYEAAAPADLNGHEMLQQAIYCFALAAEVRRQQLGDLSEAADGDIFRQKCAFDVNRFDHWDPDAALRQGLIDLTGWLASALAEILNRLPR